VIISILTLKKQFGKEFISLSDITILENPRLIIDLGKFINSKVDELCAPCCVKELIKNKIVNLTLKFYNKILIIRAENNQCDDILCSDQLCKYADISLCGKVYINNNSPDNIEVLKVTLGQYIKMVIGIIYLSFSSKCCCNKKHKLVCDCEMNFNDAIKYILSFICFYKNCETVPDWITCAIEHASHNQCSPP